MFLKPATAIVPHGGAVRIPSGLGAVHHEVELVVAIGKGGRAIPEEHALEHVLGYAVGLDMTLRDLQGKAKEKGEPWTIAKGFDTSAPVSEVVPQAELGDGSGLEIALDVNGVRRQGATTSAMLHGVPALIAHVSRQLTLARGDLIFTGTPSGVGPVVPGDVLEARIEKVGVLRVRVEAEESTP
jgi:2-keto-4-pentenoate hydratase/2-oxohepta-3-ene-1,7-dioic acid hydratase in catechol pathway